MDYQKKEVDLEDEFTSLFPSIPCAMDYQFMPCSHTVWEPIQVNQDCSTSVILLESHLFELIPLIAFALLGAAKSVE